MVDLGYLTSIRAREAPELIRETNTDSHGSSIRANFPLPAPSNSGGYVSNSTSIREVLESALNDVGGYRASQGLLGIDSRIPYLDTKDDSRLPYFLGKPLSMGDMEMLYSKN